MDEQQLQQQIVQLVQAAMQGDQQATQQIQQIMQAAQQGDQQAAQLAQMIQAVAQQMQQQQVQAAKFGAKLNYIKQLRGVCPDGYEMKYFKAGGQLCKQCVQKQKKMEEGGKAPSGPIDSFKCGHKMKKKAEGGNIDFAKCGGKTKKTAKAQKGTKLIAKTGKGEDFMAGSPTNYWDKPAQSLQYPDGRQFMTRVIPQPGDTTFVAPNFVPMNDPRYPTYRDRFNKLWNSRKQVAKPTAKPGAAIDDEETPL